MSLQTSRIVLKTDGASLHTTQRLLLRKGERKEILFQLVKSDNTALDLTGKTIEMDWTKKDGTAFFGVNKTLTTEAGTNGYCKWVMDGTHNIDNVTEFDDYIGHLKITTGGPLEVQETFLVMVREGTP